MEFLYIFVYMISSFALTEMLVFYDGAFHVFKYIRDIAAWIHPHVGELFNCVVCCSSWVGITASLINYFFIPLPFTPFNIILGTTGMWWVIVFMDLCFTAGTTLLLNHLDEKLAKDDDDD